jgi:hypothetical protein
MSLKQHILSGPEKPAPMPPDTASIPAELKRRKQWVLWRWEWSGKKWTKVPYQRNGASAKSNLSSTWCTFDEALEACPNFDGVGFVFAKNHTSERGQPHDIYCGIDLDDALDENGNVRSWAQPLLDLLDTYCEISPSRTGVKSILIGTKPPALGRAIRFGEGHVEIYDRGRFFVITGRSLNGAPKPIQLRQDALDQLAEKFGSRTRTESASCADEPSAVSASSAAEPPTEAVAIIAGLWPPPGCRHKVRLPLAGALFAAGASVEQALEFMDAVHALAGDADPADGRKAVHSTQTLRMQGKPFQGWPVLKEILAGELALSPAVIAASLDQVQLILSRAYTLSSDDAANSPYILTTFANVKPRPVRYLIPNFLPLGKLVLIAGDGGNYKSALTIDIAACLTTGRPCLGLSYTAPDPCEVLLISCEDDIADTIMPRLLAHGANPGRVRRIEERDQSGKVQEFTLAAYRRLESTLQRHPDIRLVVIDPAGAYVGRTGCNDHRDSELRALLAPLAETAARHNVCICLIKHLNKGVTAKAVHKVGGGVGYVNTVRAAYIVVPDPDQGERRLLLPLKCNLSAPFPGRSFTSELVPEADRLHILREYAGDLDNVDRDALGQQLFRLMYHGEVHISADQAVAEPPKRSVSDIDNATDWLRKYLQSGAQPSEKCRAEGNAALNLTRGLKWWRASVLKDRLSGKSKHLGFGENGVWYFTLPESPWPPDPVPRESRDSRESRESDDKGEQHNRDSLANLDSSSTVTSEEKAPDARESPSALHTEQKDSLHSLASLDSLTDPRDEADMLRFPTGDQNSSETGDRSF